MGRSTVSPLLGPQPVTAMAPFSCGAAAQPSRCCPTGPLLPDRAAASLPGLWPRPQSSTGHSARHTLPHSCISYVVAYFGPTIFLSSPTETWLRRRNDVKAHSGVVRVCRLTAFILNDTAMHTALADGLLLFARREDSIPPT